MSAGVYLPAEKQLTMLCFVMEDRRKTACITLLRV